MVGPGRLNADLLAAAESMDGRNCLVALSGGADSAALAWLAGQHALSARAVHVNHSLPDSDQMEAAARSVADHLELPLAVVTVVVPPGGASWEDKARRVRYEALTADLASDEVLVTAHTADDVAETMLINLGRGTGLRGLAGIPRERGGVLRPLLGVRRSSVRELADELALPYVDDPANAGSADLRSRVRNTVMPQYQAALGRDPVSGMVRAADHVSNAAALIGDLAGTVPVVFERHVARAPRARLRQLDPTVASEVLRRMVTAVRPPHPPTSAELGRIVAVVDGAAPVAEIEGGLVATLSRTNVLIGPPPHPEPAVAWEADEVVFAGWTLRRRSLPHAPGQRLSSAMACVLPDLGAPLTVRAIDGHDTFPIRDGTKSAPAAIAEAGVPLPARSAHPVVLIGGTPAWIPGVRAVLPGWEDGPANGYLFLDVVEEGPWK